MSSPWEPCISQAMQRHGGSNRSLPKVKLPLIDRPKELAAPESRGQASADSAASEKVEQPAK